MVNMRLTERAILLRVDASIDDADGHGLTNVFAASYGHRDACVMYKTTTCTTLQIQKAIELRETIERRRSEKIKRPRSQRGLSFYLASGGISRRKPREIL